MNLGEPLFGGAVGLTKGYTGCAVILYGIVRTMMVEDASSMSEAEREHFTQCFGWIEGPRAL